MSFRGSASVRDFEMAVVAKRAEKLLGVVVDQRLPCPTGCPRPAADRCLCGWKKP